MNDDMYPGDWLVKENPYVYFGDLPRKAEICKQLLIITYTSERDLFSIMHD